ncbi:hypothetical protein B1964_01745 [Gordonia sp. i37]|nr:hypothetical protein B1964_01745 [Gordonia sp. i37]
MHPTITPDPDMPHMPSGPAITTRLTDSFLSGTRAETDGGDGLVVYLYQFAPGDGLAADDELCVTPRVFAGTATGDQGVDFDDPASAIRFGLAIARAGLRAAELKKAVQR